MHRVGRLRHLVTLALLWLSVLAGGQTIRLQASQAQLFGPTLRVVQASAGRKRAGHESTYVSGFEQPADALRFGFRAKPGFYNLTVTYRSPQQKGYEVTADGRGLSGLFPPSQGDDFRRLSVGRVELAAGENDVTFHRGWGFYDIQSISLRPVPIPRLPLPVTAPPVDPDSTPEARAWLAELEAGYGQATALGVYADADAAYALATTGVRPAIMGGELMRFNPEFVAHEPPREDDVARLIADAQAGYRITLSWHWAPSMGALETDKAPWWQSFYTENTRFDAAHAVDPATPEHAAALADLDAIAVQLRRLQDAHVPVLFRPLHEAQGGWFWWGAAGPAVYRALWAMVYDRLTRVDGIHNLLWVYTSAEDPAWYPGDNRVDVVGIDAYPKDLEDAESGLWDTLQRQHDGRKMLAISEFGGVPDIPRMERFGERWLYAVSWSAELGPKKNDPAELRRIYLSSP